MLQQILRDMYIDPELLAELSEEQKQVLFIKMREEQVRRWKEHETEREKKENGMNDNKMKSSNKKGANVHYLLGADGNPWTWVFGENDEDTSDYEKEKSLRAMEDKEVERKAKELAAKEAAELRKTELAAIELRTKQLKNEEEKLEKEYAEKEKLLKGNRLVTPQTNKTTNKLVIKLDENEKQQMKTWNNAKEKENNDKRKLHEIRERKRMEEEKQEAAKLAKEKLEREKVEKEKKEREEEEKRKAEIKRKNEMKKADEQRRQDELKRKEELMKQEALRKEKEREEIRKENERLQQLEKEKKEEEERLAELKRLEQEEAEKMAKKKKELKEIEDQRTREIYESIKKQKEEERRTDEETRKRDHEAWIERERKAKEAETARRSSVSRARREVRHREEEVKELQKQGFIEVASGLYRRLSLSKSKVHRIEQRIPVEGQTTAQRKERPTISSPELISATGTTIPVRSIKPQKPGRSPPSVPKRSTQLGPAPPPPRDHGNAVAHRKTDRPGNRQQIIEWWQDVEMRKGSGFEDDVPLPWFHGIISRQEAEGMLGEEPVGTFLVRVSERVWGYTISYRAVDRCKHFLIDTSDNSYQFFGPNQIAHASLNDLVKFHRDKPVSGIGRELLLKPCGQKEGVEPDYKELVSQTTTI